MYIKEEHNKVVLTVKTGQYTSVWNIDSTELNRQRCFKVDFLYCIKLDTTKNISLHSWHVYRR